LARSLGLDFEHNPVATLPSQGSNVVAFPVASKEPVVMSLAQLEAEAINNTLIHCRGNFTEAAKTLKIGRATLYRKVKEYGLEKKVQKSA
jgi:DNA-binding NtrC family response regulator